MLWQASGHDFFSILDSTRGRKDFGFMAWIAKKHKIDGIKVNQLILVIC